MINLQCVLLATVEKSNNILCETETPLTYVQMKKKDLNSSMQNVILKKQVRALAWWLSWLEFRPVHQRVVGSTPGQGAFGRQLIVASLSPPPSPLSLKSMSMSSGEDLEKKKKRWVKEIRILLWLPGWGDKGNGQRECWGLDEDNSVYALLIFEILTI